MMIQNVTISHVPIHFFSESFIFAIVIFPSFISHISLQTLPTNSALCEITITAPKKNLFPLKICGLQTFLHIVA